MTSTRRTTSRSRDRSLTGWTPDSALTGGAATGGVSAGGLHPPKRARHEGYDERCQDYIVDNRRPEGTGQSAGGDPDIAQQCSDAAEQDDRDAGGHRDHHNRGDDRPLLDVLDEPGQVADDREGERQPPDRVV